MNINSTNKVQCTCHYFVVLCSINLCNFCKHNYIFKWHIIWNPDIKHQLDNKNTVTPCKVANECHDELLRHEGDKAEPEYVTLEQQQQ